MFSLRLMGSDALLCDITKRKKPRFVTAFENGRAFEKRRTQDTKDADSRLPSKRCQGADNLMLVDGVSMRRNSDLLSVMMLLLPLSLVTLGITATADDKNDAIILDSRRYEILSGRHSKFAEFQQRLQWVLTECGDPGPALVQPAGSPSGRIGVETRQAIQRAFNCPATNVVPHSSRASEGVITVQLWRAIMGSEPIPSVHDRALSLVLSFEATDFGDQPEWNLCQDGSSTDASGKFICFNESDPCSYLTWGPRGATAGVGREIQFVLWQLAKHKPDLLRKEFGNEYVNLARFFRLKAGVGDRCDGPVPLKIFMCAVWRSPMRRAAWNVALARLGGDPEVRRLYNQLYAVNEFDGGKLRDFYALWKELGLTPSEVDYAFFLDRATHLGGPPDATDATIRALSNCTKGEKGSVSLNGSARRCVARMQKHVSQVEYRIARDVAYYLDSYKEGALDDREVRAWARYVPISAVHNFGLRDDKPFPLAESESLASLDIDLPDASSTELTPHELTSCPASIISPKRRTP